MEPDHTLDQTTPSLAFAGTGEMPRVIVERQIDCLPTPLFVSLHRVNALADEQEQAFGFRAVGRRCPWRPMCADRVTPCDCLTPSHPELDRKSTRLNSSH